MAAQSREMGTKSGKIWKRRSLPNIERFGHVDAPRGLVNVPGEPWGVK